jgi:D-sedoheptulose 7-phosphate isomerase
MKYNQEHINSINNLFDGEFVSQLGNIILDAIKKNNKILICGNGGSAADSNHISAEFVGKFEKERSPINALSLSSNIALITAIGNDFGFKYIFSRQVEAVGGSGDILIAISTSGKSENIIEAINTALKLNLKIFFITGKKSFYTFNNDNLHRISIDSENTATIQEAYMFLLHNVARYIDSKLDD